ncbi:MAG: hypothetical protein ACR2O1_12490 [Boseongicola sp.]
MMRINYQMSLVALFLVFAIYAISFAAETVFAVMARIPGFEFLDSISIWVWSMLLILAWTKGWLVINRPYSCHGRIVIDAPIEEIWDHVRPRVRGNTFHGGFERIVALPGEQDRFDLIVDARLRNEEANVTDRLQTTIAVEEPKRYLKLTYLNAAEFPLFAKELVSTEYFLEPVAGGIAVSIVENLARITPGMVLALLFLNPSKDGLTALKAAAEGWPDPSRQEPLVQELDL